MAFKMKGFSPFNKSKDKDWMNPNHRDHDKMMKIMIEKKDKDGNFVDPKTGKPWKRGVGSHAYKYKK
jgi:hypothetical protein